LINHSRTFNNADTSKNGYFIPFDQKLQLNGTKFLWFTLYFN